MSAASTEGGEEAQQGERPAHEPFDQRRVVLMASSPTPNGGSAFPEIETDQVWSESHNSFRTHTYSYGGMTLRDYFAAKALNGLLQNMHVQGALHESLRRNVECAWQLADEMLKQRDTKESADVPA